MRPGDIVRIGKDFWEIEGIFLGATGQQSLVRLSPITQRPGTLGETPATVLVPMQFFPLTQRYSED